MINPENRSNSDVDSLLRQAMLQFQQGDLLQAQCNAEKILEISPLHVSAMQLLGGIRTQFGDYETAVDLFSRAIEIKPDLPANYNNLGYVLHLMGRLDDAKKACLYAIKIKPDFAAAYNTLAVVLKDMGQLEQALSSAQQAIQLSPDFIEIHSTIAAILNDMGQYERMLPICQHALMLRPDFAEVHNLMVIALSKLNRTKEALSANSQAIQLRPDFAAHYVSRGNLLSDQGMMLDALDALSQAIEINPNNAVGYYNRGNILGNIGRFSEAEADYRKALLLEPKHANAHSNLLFVYASAARLSYEKMLEEQKIWDAVHGEQGRLNAISLNPIRTGEGRRLRVGYVSPDFCMHPVGYFIEPLLASHNTKNFEIFCYANMLESQADKITRRLRNLTEHWRFVKDINDADMANMIHQDGIDILVDLAGHTMGNRLTVFSYHAAPVQAMYLGYCASSGLQAMDYWITDEVLHPADTPECSSEIIERLPRCSFCYRPPEEANIKPWRTDVDVDAGVVFASYSHFSKLQLPVIETWSEILKVVPGSRLAIMDKYMDDEATRNLLIDQFRHQGIGEDRLIISGHLSYADYYRSYSGVDIVLDTFPRTGGTTTADALWMGVPVVSLAGERYVERISASKLHAVGLDELITKDRSQYVETAKWLADNESYRRDLRENLRDRMRNSQLCDGRGLAAVMENIYGNMYARAAR